VHGKVASLVKAAWVWFGYRNADRVVVQTDKNACELERTWRIWKKRVWVIPNGVDIPPANEPTEKKSGGEVVILSAGRLVKQKDQSTLLRAVGIVASKVDVSLELVGEGPERGKLERLAKELGVESSVKLVGYVEDIKRYYARADLFVISSIFEGFPNVLLEALAHGVPVVSTDCPTGPAEILGEGRYGRLARTSDPGSLGGEILKALDDSWDRSELIGRAETFSVDRQLGRWRQLVTNMLE